MTVRIEGLEQLQGELEGLRALERLEGELKISLDLDDERSIETEIRRVSALIDERIAPYGSSKLVASVVRKMKERCVTHVREQVREAREHPSQ
jgi:hypothetical protein